MPFGKWENIEQCIADPDLAKRYPDDETRKRVCGALQARLEAEPTAASRVTEAPHYWIVHDVVATRIGVNPSHKLLKDEAAVRRTAEVLDGTPFRYGEHPRDAKGTPILDTDPRAAPGIAVNSRYRAGAAIYDGLLWKENPAGHEATVEDLARNAAWVAAVRKGEAVENSLAARSMEVLEEGSGQRMDGKGFAAYDARQVDLRPDHIAILRPIAPGVGSCPAPACGSLPADRVAEAYNITRSAALQAIVSAAKR